MKKKEREHLKEDPFINFIESVLSKFQQYKREILMGLGMVAVVVIVFVLILFFRSHSHQRENGLYSEALAIRNSSTLTSDQKIEALAKLEPGKGLSSSIPLFLASLYFEKGEIDKARQTVQNMGESRLKIIRDQRSLLEAEIMAASGQQREALDIMNKLLSDSSSELARDHLLLRIARIQVHDGQREAAASNLRKLIADHPGSFYSQEAQTLLGELE